MWKSLTDFLHFWLKKKKLLFYGPDRVPLLDRSRFFIDLSSTIHSPIFFSTLFLLYARRHFNIAFYFACVNVIWWKFRLHRGHVSVCVLFDGVIYTSFPSSSFTVIRNSTRRSLFHSRTEFRVNLIHTVQQYHQSSLNAKDSVHVNCI